MYRSDLSNQSMVKSRSNLLSQSMAKKTSRLSSTLTAKQETLGYNQASDWWALGVLVYHMMTGFTPFSHPNEDRVKRLITSVNVCFPDAQSD